MRKISFIILSGLLLLCFSSCIKEYHMPSGEIFGNVKPEGVLIVFDRGDKQFKTTSGQNGKFSVNMEAGTYTISYEKEGFIPFKEFGLTFLGSPSPVFINTVGTLDPVYTATITNLSINNSQNNQITINGIYTKNSDPPSTAPGTSDYVSTRWFIGTSRKVSRDNFIQTTTTTININNNLFHTTIELEKDLFTNNDKIYLTGYLGPTWYNYYDWGKGKKIYAVGNNPSEIAEFIIPDNFFTN